LFGRYNQARKSLRGSISPQSRQGLDWMNFFFADVQTAFGAFVAFYKGQVGLALGVGTLAGVISQIPGAPFAEADLRPWASWCRPSGAPASSGRLPPPPQLP